MTFFEAIRNWWDSRDLRRIRKRRRLKSAQYLNHIKKAELNENIEDSKEEELDIEKPVTTLPRKIRLKGHFFVQKFKANTKWGILFVLAMSGLILFLLLVLFSSDIFSLHTTEIEIKNGFLIRNNQLETNLDNFKGRNLFLLSSLDIENQLKNSFPTISNVEVEKMYPSSIHLIVTEYKPAIILRKGQLETVEYLLNQAGYVLAQRPYSGMEAEYLVVLSTDQDFEATVGDRLMSSSTVDFIYRAANLFQEKVGIKVISIWWLPRENEVHMWSEKYFKVMMSLQRPVSEQIDEMIKALSEFRSFRDFEYIDLRIKNKVFVKPR